MTDLTATEKVQSRIQELKIENNDNNLEKYKMCPLISYRGQDIKTERYCRRNECQVWNDYYKMCGLINH